jgi:glutamate-ammonia-ligase adenylyltransferase
MRALRQFKTAVALLTALADLAGVWPVMTVTRRLSEAADAAVGAAVAFCSGRQRHGASGCPIRRTATSCWPWASTVPSSSTTSSDIDLIVFYDLSRIRLRARRRDPAFLRAPDRETWCACCTSAPATVTCSAPTLRLRPDPAATPMALSTEAALNYYESFGQNWERAALIKARPVAGDLAAGQAVLEDLAPLHLAQVPRLRRRSPTSTP